MNIKLSQLITNSSFSTEASKEITRYTYITLIEPEIKIDKDTYTTKKPIKHIDIIRNHIMQRSEMELIDENGNTMEQILLDGLSLENTTITFQEYRNDE